MKLEILHEDDHCLAVNKPHNLLIHNSYYARNIKEKTVLENLEELYESPFYPVHRIDRKTSGVLLLAKERKYVSPFQQVFQSGNLEKIYTAIVRGFCEDEIRIESPVKHPETGIYKEASTLCIPLKKVELPIAVHPYESARYSLVKLIPTTGRIHQLRIHMNKISRPIIGDYKYGDRFHNRMIANRFGCDNMFLHAEGITFNHPFTNTELTLKASYPTNWNRIFEEFRWEF